MWENCHDKEFYDEAVKSYLNQYVIVYAEADGKIPLVYKNKPAHLVGTINFPGGKIEDGEHSATAVYRELEEETGLRAGIIHKMGLIKGNNSEIHCWKTSVHYEELKPGEGETEKFEWFDLSTIHLNPKLMPNLRLIIPLMQANIKGWTVVDTKNDFRHTNNHLELLLGDDIQPISVAVKGMCEL